MASTTLSSVPKAADTYNEDANKDISEKEVGVASDIESHDISKNELKPQLTKEHREYLLQRHGTTELHPVPSFSPHDPYNWPEWKKNLNLILVSFHAMMTTFQAAIIIPAYELFAEELGTTIAGASYLTSAQIAVLGFAPLFWKPLSQRYGRQPIWLISTFCCGLLNIGCALSTTYGAMMACRVFSAFFIAPPLGIGSGVVVETFLASQRGQKMGVWTLLVTLGPVSAPFFGGFISYHAGTQWLYWVLVIVNFIQFLAYLAFGSETRFMRPSGPQDTAGEKPGRLLGRRLDKSPITWKEIVEPFAIGKHLTVLIPAISYSVVFCFGSVLLTVEIPQTFVSTFGLNAQQLGLNFIALIIGTILGEQSAGPLSDFLMTRKTKSLGHRPDPEYRLWLSYIGYTTVMIGLIVFGVQLQNAVPGQWNVTPIIGAAISSFGNQLVTTVMVTYAIDCHPEHGSAVGIFISVIRQTWGFIGPFWFPTMFESLGYATSFGMLAALVFGVSVLPVIYLQLRGRKLRARI